MTQSHREILLTKIDQFVMNDPEIGRYCDRIARERSGTTFWSKDEFEQNEDTSQYALYWSIYVEVQVKLVTEAALNLSCKYD